jgi:hypothetical protein
VVLPPPQLNLMCYGHFTLSLLQVTQLQRLQINNIQENTQDGQ